MKTIRHPAAIVLMAAALAVIAGTAAPRADDAGMLRFGLSSTLLEDVNRTDALAAMAVWLRGAGTAAGLWKSTDGRIFDDPSELIKEVAADRLDFVALSSPEYLAVERTIPADPCMVYVAPDVLTEYVLIARAGVSTVGDLRGKSLLFFNPSGRPGIADAWFDVYLAEQGLVDRAHAFQRTQLAGKASQAILSVFFGRADAAVVTRSGFDTAVEMNPQVGKQLTVLARSPGLLPGVVCVRRSLAADMRARYIAEAVKLHERIQYRQTFLVLKMTRLAPWDPHLLDAARVVLAKRQAAAKAGRGR
jgi:ABC-type phosphate/phosphonate transport system substrate-binding protein